MTIIYEIVTILLIYIGGAALSFIIPVPGSLLSLFLFFILLLTKVFKEERYKLLSGLVLRNLAFFFIPSAVQVIDSVDILHGSIGKIALILIISNILVMIVSGIVIQLLLKKGRKDD